MASLTPGLNAVMHAGLPPPEEIGYELEQDGAVIAEAELAWLNRKLVLLMPVHEASAKVWEVNGWKTLVAKDAWQQELLEELRKHINQEEVHQGRQ